jgi:hypothetical protein
MVEAGIDIDRSNSGEHPEYVQHSVDLQVEGPRMSPLDQKSVQSVVRDGADNRGLDDSDKVAVLRMEKCIDRLTGEESPSICGQQSSCIRGRPDTGLKCPPFLLKFV